MELLSLYALLGFVLASYSVIANDSVQTLGTFIASNSEKFKIVFERSDIGCFSTSSSSGK